MKRNYLAISGIHSVLRFKSSLSLFQGLSYFTWLHDYWDYYIGLRDHLLLTELETEVSFKLFLLPPCKNTEFVSF